VETKLIVVYFAWRWSGFAWYA